jgi:hypothetical protein
MGKRKLQKNAVQIRGWNARSEGTACGSYEMPSAYSDNLATDGTVSISCWGGGMVRLERGGQGERCMLWSKQMFEMQ